MNRIHPSRRVVPLLIALALAGCDAGDSTGLEPEPDGDNGSGELPATGNLRFTIKHVVSDGAGSTTPLAANGTTQYQTAYGNTFSVSRLRYYIARSGLQVESTKVDFEITHLVDTDDPSTLRFYALDVPADHYHDIVFTIGLPESENITGALTGTEHDAMAWPAGLGGGYYYMKLEGTVWDGVNQPHAFLTGTGRVDTGGNPQPHAVGVLLSPHFNVIPGKTVDVELIMDVSEWYRGPNVIDLETHVGGIDSDDAMQAQMAANGADVFVLGVIKTL
ncbi:MAG TPA: MbnP family protein [bacterium]|nr:MbnP family protein [bacterium]